MSTTNFERLNAVLHHNLYDFSVDRLIALRDAFKRWELKVPVDLTTRLAQFGIFDPDDTHQPFNQGEQ